MKRTQPVTLHSLSCRFGLTLSLALAVATLIAVPCASATAIASSSLQLESLTITSASGSIVFAPTAQSFAQAQNSLGELVTNFGSGTTATSSATVTWADASGSADSISQTAFTTADVSLPSGAVDAASSVGRGALYDFSFSIAGTTGTVPVQFGAMLDSAQSLVTDAFGVQATSEVIFDLSIDGNPVLFSDSPFTIGPNQSLSAGGPFSLNNSMNLTAGQTYTLYLELDAESSGINTIPEPATLPLLLGGAVLPFVRRWLCRQRS